MKIAFIFIVTFSFLACSKIRYYPDAPLDTPIPMVLSHRGASGVHPILENTLAAVNVGLNNLDGVEVDVLFSKDNELWLGHDAFIKDCDGIRYCFSDLSYEDLARISECDDNASFSRLEGVFNYMRKFHPDKIISLDIKRPSCGIFPQSSYDAVGDEIIRLTRLYGMEKRTLVESTNRRFLTNMREQSSLLKLFFLSRWDFDYGLSVAIEERLTGISYSIGNGDEITEEHIRVAHQKGVEVMLWGVDDAKLLEDVYNMYPNYIQTNKLSYYSYLE